MKDSFKPIRDFAKIRRGASPRPIGDPTYFGGNVGWVRISDVTSSSKFLRKTDQYLSKLGESKSLRVDKGDLVMSICGTIGKPIIIDMPACIHDGFVQLYEIKNADVEYLYYVLQFSEKGLERKGQPGTQVNLNTTIVGDYLIYAPPLLQQQKIAKILSNCDEVIKKTEAAIVKYQALKQGMMHDLFTRGIDLKTNKLRPTYQDAPELYKESALGMIPKDWTEGHFIDFADGRISHSFTGGPFGSDLQTTHYTKEGVRIIQLQNIGDGHFNNGYKIYTSEERANYLRACNIYPGDIILSKMAEPIARACIIPVYHNRYLMASDGIRLSINKKKFNLRFVLETINQKRFRNIAELRSTGTTRSRIGLTELKEIPVCYPNLREQNLIGAKLDNLEQSLSIERSSLAKYQQIKAGLMQDLLTGKVEVNV